MANEKPLLDDIFNFGGITEDGIAYDGWSDDSPPNKAETKDMSSLNNNAGAPLVGAGEPKEEQPAKPMLDPNRLRAKRKTLKAPKMPPLQS